MTQQPAKPLSLTQGSANSSLTQFKNLLQEELFPFLEDRLGPLDKAGRLLAAVLSAEPLAKHVPSRRCPYGRRPHDRRALAAAFFAKTVYNMPHVRHLIQRLRSDRQLRRLCGWNNADEVPSEATFSRSLTEFSASELPAKMHEAIVRSSQRDRLIEHIARDSTAIAAREHLPGDNEKKKAGQRPAPRKEKTPKPKGKRGAKKGPHKRAKACERGPRLQRQQRMPLPQMLAELPRACSLGVKTNSQGHKQYWRGYKLHWDVADGGRIPISCILTGASVHDSQVAIPLMQLSAQRVRWNCELMDSAYDAYQIRQQIRHLGHQALIKPNPAHPRSLRENAFSDEDKQRFQIRTIVEQLNARLKDEFGGRHIYLRGAAKIMTQLMFGVVAITVDQLLRLSG